ncbi:hypothetical protein WMW72_22005 [Paenibacillus filicis]|uniref:Uncharacterized protein n=1 Tax=Paenibacillus filicis TaxID=669464 RepID=A0ABU9DNZ0_9BACL
MRLSRSTVAFTMYYRMILPLSIPSLETAAIMKFMLRVIDQPPLLHVIR